MNTLRRGITAFWMPAILYLAIFLILNPHVVGQFSTHFLFSGPDGFQNVWNLWWVNRAASQLSLPWSTTLLHHPYGTTLLGHTLNPFNGVLAIVLLKFFTLVQTYNLIVVFSFVAGGLTMFWLCREMTGSFVGSLVGGAVFTFSAFHIAHTSSHLQLVALEWIPLFLLCWIRFCDAPTVARGAGAAAVLFLVALCDFYYLTYCVIAGAIFYVCRAALAQDALFLLRGEGPGPIGPRGDRERLGAWPLRRNCGGAKQMPEATTTGRRSAAIATLGFVGPAALTSGALIAALLVQHAATPFIGTHSPLDLAMDFVSPFVWSESSRYHDAVPLWRSLSRFPLEASVYVGLSVIALAVYTLTRPTRPPIRHLGFWVLTGAFFFVMSLGPNLHVAGTEISLGLRGTVWGQPDMNLLVLPYAVVWLLFPPWRLAGVPLRMMVMVQLVAAVVTAGGIQMILNSSSRWKHLVVAAFITVLALDFLPMPLGMMEPQIPAYVEELRRLPDGAVLDLASAAPQALFYQTVHEKPIVFGYISRVPRSVYDLDQAIVTGILDGRWEQVARESRVTYVVKRGSRAAELLVQNLNSAPLPEIDSSRRIFQDGDVAIYRF